MLDAVAEIHAISEGTEDQQITLSADDFLPLFVYVILQSVGGAVAEGWLAVLARRWRRSRAQDFFCSFVSLLFLSFSFFLPSNSFACRSSIWQRSKPSTSGGCWIRRCSMERYNSVRGFAARRPTADASTIPLPPLPSSPPFPLAARVATTSQASAAPAIG